jgi:3-hydroxybutyryl-CoA dehydratase
LIKHVTHVKEQEEEQDHGKGTKSMSEETKNSAPLPAVGARATRVRTFTDADIVRFAEVSGDRNPVHLDDAYAARSPFGRRVAHGFLTGSLISAVIGMDLPGPGSIYLGQTLKFLAPVYIGDTVTVSVEVIGVREEKRLVTLRTDCTNQDGKLVLTGEATVKYLGEA